MQKSPFSNAQLAASDCSGQGIGASYLPGENRSFIITLTDVDGKLFLANVHYKHIAHPLTCTVVRVESHERCDITFTNTIQPQIKYLTQKAEMDALGHKLVGTINEMQFITTQKTERLNP